MLISWFILWNFAAGNLHHSLTNTENILKVTLTGFPVSSSKAMKDLPMLISRDFLQMTPLSKQSMFSAATLSITSALLCGGEKHTITETVSKNNTETIYRSSIQKQYTFLPMVSLYSTDLYVVTCQDMQQCPNKGRDEGDCWPVNMDVNNSRFKNTKITLQMFSEGGNVLNTFVRDQGYTLGSGE